MFLESGLLREEEDHYVLTGPLASVPIPATLHDSLMARLDRLPTAKATAPLGAVLGREFSYAVLQALARLDEAILQARLGGCLRINACSTWLPGRADGLCG